MSDTKTTATRSKAPKLTDVEFKFTGDPEVGARGVPARDLTRADVDRLTTRRTIPEPGARGLHRGESGFSEARAKVAREIAASGKFKKRS
jgi:hypothetical protein